MPCGLADRFWSKVERGEPDECWNWKAAKTENGYGLFGVENKIKRAHRVSYELAYGKIPKGKGYHGLCVCHSCDNRSCVNPAHLFLGSQRDNIRDMWAKGRNRTHPLPIMTGSSHHATKLSETDVLNIRAIFKHTRATQGKLAKIYKVHQATISKIVNNQARTHTRSE